MRDMERNNRRVLVVDDEPAMRLALEGSFRQQQWQVEAACGVSDAVEKFRRRPVPVVVSDVRMGDGSGLELAPKLREIDADVAVILLTAFADVADAVQAIKSGACDYLLKPAPFAQIETAVERALARPRTGAAPAAISPQEFVGHSPALMRVLSKARMAAQTDADVLVEAESGTGKELLARWIHRCSSRRSKPFVAVNCAAIPETLLESELFGHARGAFTGAAQAHSGRFEQAQGGTLLLDEIGEMPLALQPKLLRVLQEREFQRIGDAQVRRADVRIIATTNRNLRERVNAGTFRADLYYRLNVIPLALPPLRERPEDIAELAEHFASVYASPSRAPHLAPGFLRGLLEHHWPGNVRELANYMRRVVALSTASEITEADLQRDEFQLEAAPLPTVQPGVSLRELERKLLEVTLEATDGNRTRTAELMGVSLRTVRNRIRDYGLPRWRYA